MIRRVKFVVVVIAVTLVIFAQCTETKTGSAVLIDRSEIVQKVEIVENELDEDINALKYEDDQLWFERPDGTCGKASFEKNTLIDIEQVTCIVDDIDGI